MDGGQPETREKVPLCVDLDSTLLRTDLLLESALVLLKQQPWLLLLIPLWLLRGKAYLKQQIAERVELDVSSLPYHQGLLGFLRTQHQLDRRLVLATASNRKFARQVADHLGLFHSIYASDSTTNLAGRRKLEHLRSEFGERGFDYAGDSQADLEIWRQARRAILVNAAPRVKEAARGLTTVERVFDDGPRSLRVYLRALRPHHWLKNLLIFVPLLAAHEFGNAQLAGQALLAFLAFGLCASSAYILNDLLDLRADRVHPTKRLRPFASGAIPLLHGVALIPLLLLGAFALASLLPAPFLALLSLYLVLTVAYSLRLKSLLVLDVVVLAGLYTLRIVAGGAAIAIAPSFWLLLFSMFIFLSLAVLKRYAELLPKETEANRPLAGRGYQPADLAVLNGLGAASGLLAVLVLALYINGDTVALLYSRPDYIWLLCPLLIYWLARTWLLTGRGEMHDDPLTFAIRDRASYGVGGAALLTVWLAL